jgi:hypothetical protein
VGDLRGLLAACRGIRPGGHVAGSNALHGSAETTHYRDFPASPREPFASAHLIRGARRATLARVAEHHETETSQSTHLTVRRRVVWLTLIAVLSGGVALAAAVALGWLLRATFTITLGYTVALWAALAGSGTVQLILHERRSSRPAILLTVTAAAGLLLCAVPAGTFATFAVDHGPTGQANPGAAVNAYFESGPLGGFGGLRRAGSIDFDRVLCDSRRDQFRRQAEAFARDLDRPVVLRIEPLPGDRVTVHGDEATVVSQIQANTTDGTPGSTLTYQSTPVTWTFQTINDDGRRVCQVDAPAICGSLLRCRHRAEQSLAGSSSYLPL